MIIDLYAKNVTISVDSEQHYELLRKNKKMRIFDEYCTIDANDNCI